MSAVAFDLSSQPLETVPCALCGGTKTTIIASHDRYGLPAQTVECVCGLRYLNPRMTADGYSAFYRHGYRPLLSEHFQRSYGVEDILSDQRKYARNLTGLVAAHMPIGTTLLDVGGSTGIVGQQFRRRWGYTVTVLDPAPDELAKAEGCTTLAGSAEDLDLPTVDLALLCRTIEHLRQPILVLKKLRACASTLVLDARDCDRWPLGQQYQVDHPYAFTRRVLERALAATGWNVTQQWTYANGWRYVGYLCH